MHNRIVCGVLLSASLLTFSLPASATTFTDSYYGGLNTYNNSPVTGASDVIGTADFQIFSMDVTRTNNDLHVIVNTNFIAHIGEDANVHGTWPGVGLGALFLGNQSTLNLNNTVNGSGVYAPYAYDTFTNDTDRFKLGVSINEHPAGTSGGPTPGTVYKLNGLGTDVILSNVANSSITYPDPGNNGFYFRQNQAVDVISGTPHAGNGITANWSFAAGPANNSSPGTLTFNVYNVFGSGADQLADSFTLAWAMTCGNDIILVTATEHAENANSLNPTPIPAALPLFMSGLGVVGLLSRKRRKKLAVAAG